VVVGGGLTGWSAALALARAGSEVIVLDRRFGASATCRSGGIIVGDTLVGEVPQFRSCEQELKAWISQEAPDVPIDWRGVLEFDRNPSRASAPIDWRDAGTVRVSGNVTGGALDPAALLGRLAAAAVARGAQFVDGFPVERIQPKGHRLVVSSGRDTIAARVVLVATDATARSSDFVPWPEIQLTVALKTFALSSAEIATTGWNGMPFYTNDLPLLWGRLIPDGGLLAGRELITLDDGRSRLDEKIAAAGKRLLTRVRGLHHAFANVTSEHLWAGPVARDGSGVPKVLEDPDLPGVFWAGGYGGHGLAQAFRLGRLAAERMLAVL